jgi:G6PDH family F420-dependent oxidoreductase
MAHATERVQLITGVTTPLFRFHPGVVAQAAATLDRLSGGRFILGVGTGENINEGPLGYEFPAYAERNARMTEALEIMRRLLDGEKLTYQGQYYVTDRARLYSPPVGPVPILLAAGGPKSASLAGELAQGVITSVKDPAETREKVVDPLIEAASEHGRPRPVVLATRWSIAADDDEEAWRAIYPWRGLRAPGRLEAVDPTDLREMADALPREEILGRYSRVSTADEVLETYLPLVEDLHADIVTFQMAALDQPGLIRMLGAEVLPQLKG